MKKLLFGIVLVLSGCLTYNEPPPDREPDRYWFVEIHYKVVGLHETLLLNIHGQGDGLSVREAEHIFRDMMGPEAKIVFIGGQFAYQDTFKAHRLTADEVEEARSR